MKSNLFVKIVAALQALLAAVALIVLIVMASMQFLCSGLPLGLFQLFVLSWWLWRIPDLDTFQEKVAPFSIGKRALTPEREQYKLQRAWRLQLSFVLVWGWICALLFWHLGNWFVLLGGCTSIGVLLLGGLFAAVAGWIVGGTWMIHLVYREKATTE